MVRRGNIVNRPRREVDSRKDHHYKRGKSRKVDATSSPTYAGLVFMCNSSAKMDCFKYRLFGLPEGKKNRVEQVKKGMKLFLFDSDLRLLYGIYSAASRGAYQWQPDAFGGAFPWQVRFSIQKDCLPLPEDVFSAAIKENYLDKRKFKMELNAEQVNRLMRLFKPLTRGPLSSPTRSRLSNRNPLDAPAIYEGSRVALRDHHDAASRYADSIASIRNHCDGPSNYTGSGLTLRDLHDVPSKYADSGVSLRDHHVAPSTYRGSGAVMRDHLDVPAKYSGSRFLEDINERNPIADYTRDKYDSRSESDSIYRADRLAQRYRHTRTKYDSIYAAIDLYVAEDQDQDYHSHRTKYELAYTSDGLPSKYDNSYAYAIPDSDIMIDKRTQELLSLGRNKMPSYESDLYVTEQDRLQLDIPLRRLDGTRPELGIDSRSHLDLPRIDPFDYRMRDASYPEFSGDHIVGSSVQEMASIFRHQVQIPELREDRRPPELASAFSGRAQIDARSKRGGLDRIDVDNYRLQTSNSRLVRDGIAPTHGLSFRDELLPESRRYAGIRW